MASKLTLLLQVVAGLSWTTLPAYGVFDTVPAEVGGVLSACSGDIISIKCGHTNTGGGVTRWIFRPPVDCSEIIEHSRPNDRQCGSSPFSFQDITRLAANVVLNSTAVATANATMTGTTVQCLNSAGISPLTVGMVTLCIFGRPTNVTISNTTNGVTIEWTVETDNQIPCKGVAYVTVTVHRTDGDISNNETMNISTTATRIEFEKLKSGQEYTTLLTTVLSSCSTDSTTLNFTFIAKDSSSGSESRMTLLDGEIAAIVFVVMVVAVCLIVLSVAILILLYKKQSCQVKPDDSSTQDSKTPDQRLEMSSTTTAPETGIVKNREEYNESVKSKIAKSSATNKSASNTDVPKLNPIYQNIGQMERKGTSAADKVKESSVDAKAVKDNTEVTGQEGSNYDLDSQAFRDAPPQTIRNVLPLNRNSANQESSVDAKTVKDNTEVTGQEGSNYANRRSFTYGIYPPDEKLDPSKDV